ncbi:rod shape-determining protein MreC [candidate division KSB1 bacterium]
MEKLVKLISLYKSFITFLICLSLSTLLIFSNQSTQIFALRAALVDIFSFVTAPLAYTSKVFRALDENELLKAENLYLRYENSILRKSEDEIFRLRELLELKKQREYTFKLGSIISWGDIPIANTVTIDLGKEDGIKKNDPVISYKGLVGKVLNVGDRSAVCQLLTDRNFKVSALTRSTGAYGLLKWKEDNIAVMEEVQKSSVIIEGDTVVTSKHGNIYPEGIPIGVVASYYEGPDLFKIVHVELFVDYLQLYDVAVVVRK